MKHQILALGALALCSAAMTAQTTQRLTATKANEYALVYSLPNTALSVTLEAEVTTVRPGEFYKYAKRYLNLDNPVTAESHSARLLSAAIGTRGIPNEDERYTVQFKSGAPTFILLSPEGIPLAVNTEDTFKAPAIELPVSRDAAPTPLETPAARQVVSQEMIQSQSTAKRAELAAQAIFAIRQTRSELVSGQAETMPPDGKSLQLMLDNLEAQEQALMAMFMGTTSTRTDVATYTLIPEKEMKDYVLARVSPLDGLVGADDLSGAPVTLNISVNSKGELPANEKGETLPFPKNGFAYRIPGEARVSVSYEGETFADDTEQIAQFGVVYGLSPATIGDKKAPQHVILDPATGAIVRTGAAR